MRIQAWMLSLHRGHGDRQPADVWPVAVSKENGQLLLNTGRAEAHHKHTAHNFGNSIFPLVLKEESSISMMS